MPGHNNPDVCKMIQFSTGLGAHPLNLNPDTTGLGDDVRFLDPHPAHR